MRIFFVTIAVVVLSACSRKFEAPVPDLSWDEFKNPSAQPLSSSAFSKMDGVYNLIGDLGEFGPVTAAKSSYTINGNDTSFSFSFFFENDAAYFICQAKQVDSNILLNGYWRKQVNTETGTVRLKITRDNGALQILRNAPMPANQSVVITGVYGHGNELPATGLRMNYTRPLYAANPFLIIAHRGGGRTSDLLPASENSLEVIRMASQLGANGIEIDVRLTKDGIPVLYHDVTLNERLVKNSGLLGPIENYTYAQLSSLVRLINGERLPTLQQALETIFYQTNMQFVWLDIKYEGNLEAVRNLQANYLLQAAAQNRNLQIVMGIFNDEILGFFKKLPNHKNIPSLVELSPEIATDLDAEFWAPQWTLGLQNSAVQQQQNAGRQVVTWTMDIPENVKQYMQAGRFNGITSNYPTVVAFYYYAKN